MNVELESFETMMAASTGVRRHTSAMYKGLSSNKHGRILAGEWDIHIEGAAGEMAVAKALGVYWNGSVDTFHKGGDVGALQVRTRSHDHYDLLVRDDDRDSDYFVLVVGKIPRFRVVGWMKGVDAKRPEWRKDYGGRPPAYFVPQSALNTDLSVLRELT